MSDIAADALQRTFAFLTTEKIVTSIDRALAPLMDSYGHPREIVIFGSGALGRIIHDIAIREKLVVRAFADNNQATWKRADSLGPEVLAPRAAVEKYNDSAVFVTGVFNSSGPRAQLTSLGARNIATYPAFYLKFGQSAPRFIGFERPEWILDRRRELCRAFSLLADDTSREEFTAQIGWRCTLDYSLLPAHGSGQHTYFDPELFLTTSDEVVVDCGAFDGDTLRVFLGRSNGSFGHVYALEPDPSNRGKLQGYVNSLPASERRRITVLPYAVGAADETVFFKAGQGVGSAIDSSASLAVESRRLDTVLPSNPTLIKMDIEGSEPDALRGAAHTLQSSRPILAISAYHYCDHLWELPLIINSVIPDHSIFLRRYAQECWELVYYAVPSERLLK